MLLAYPSPEGFDFLLLILPIPVFGISFAIKHPDW
jgi:hypothetical protein